MKAQYQTPPEICKYMVQLAYELMKTPGNCLEPTPGEGNLVTAILEQSKNTLTLHHPSNYFDAHLHKSYEIIIANPPFSKPSLNLENAPEEWKQLKGMAVGYRFLEDFMQLSDNIVVLMPWFTILDSDVRFRKIRDFGLISVTPLPRKTFDYARIQTVVLQMQKGYKGETKFHTHLI